jgi:hypothetical protein
MASHVLMHRRGVDTSPTRPASTREEATLRRNFNAYLKSISENHQPQPGPKDSVETLNERIVAAQEAGQFLKVIKLIEAKHQRESNGDGGLEAYFITHAKDYSTRFGISRRSWREFGVPAKVLRAAGIE